VEQYDIICKLIGTDEVSTKKLTQTKIIFLMFVNKFDLVFITMFNFFGFKLASMQALIHFCQILPNVFSQMMHLKKNV
jgi:hypothetical protein